MARIPARDKAHKAVRSSFANSEDTFKTSKKDKQRIKHASLVSRIEKANTKTRKRRRPSKKLITTLESLADALPTPDDNGDAIVDGNRIRHKSLKSRPGAMKRKEKIQDMERDRFAKNIAQMATLEADSSLQVSRGTTILADGAPDAETSTAKKWAALRDFIASTTKQAS